MFRLIIITAILIFAPLQGSNLLISRTSGADIYIIEIDGGIGPATASYIGNNLEKAADDKVEALIIRLNTPGGLLESTRDIVSSILESPVPVIVFVGPGGARAGSAGVFITLAANIAVMAPGTNIGAAHPVGIGGESDSSAMFDKVTNDASAFIRSIAQKRGRNEEWAELAVRESISATENEALESEVIDYVTDDIESVISVIDGDTVDCAGKQIVLKTKNANLVFIEKNWREKMLDVLSNPNFAYIFMMLAIYGILFELYNPGAIFPGVIGGISAVLAAYSLQMLPVNYAGLGLIMLSVILFIIEIKVQSYGMLTVGGVLSLLLGSIMLIDSPFEFMEISLTVIITAVVLTTAFFSVVIALGLKAQQAKKTGGSDGIAGEKGVAIQNISPGIKGKVKVHGEIWQAESKESIISGDRIVVKDAIGFVLKVIKDK